MMKVCVFDIECDGLKPTKIHCLSVCKDGINVKTTSNYDKMREFFLSEENILVAHNGFRFDSVVLERLLGIKIKAKLVDTLALSWYLEPDRIRHGLAEWGEEFGVPKPKVDDWFGISDDEKDIVEFYEKNL